MSSGKGQASPSAGPIVRCGHLRKSGSLISGLKPLSKKWFVLRGDILGHPACLEYYDSKKKFDNRQPPKRSIAIRSCYNINRRSDTKHKHVIGLYTKDDCFSLILDNDKELEDWLTAMLMLCGDVPDGEQPRPTFEHVWQVTFLDRGLAKQQNLHGPYRLCLTDRTLSLIQVGAEDSADCLEFPLTTIRRSGCTDKVFYMEVGRSTVTGEGDFYMTAEDNNIAHNMDATIKNAMRGKKKSGNKDKDEVLPQTRKRSASANEASKPISFIRRRPTGSKPLGFSPLEEQSATEDQRESENVTASAPSQSCSQSQSTSGNTLMAVAGTRSLGTYAISSTTADRRRHSVASQPITTINTQTINVTTQSLSTTSNNNNTTTTMIITTKSHQRTLSLPLAAVVINQTQSSKRTVLRCATGRDRCDSLPSRARTTSEGQPAPLVLGCSRAAHLVHLIHPTRPHSMYGRGLSYSPPVSSMPISPASGACSTDSAGSSLSMDEGGDNMIEDNSTRYGHSLTPDEPVILEENMDDYVPWSNNVQTNKYSPNFKSHSPSRQSSYVEMYSPCSSSPGRGGAYMPMSPATTGMSHSRASSLVEESTDGYVPMAPVGDDGYVDMDPSNGHNGHFSDDMSQHGSTCSVTSGTPSTDLRLSDYPLDKVSSFLTPSEDLLRPTRAYSVGSRDDPSNRYRKNRLDIALQESSRVRAFSVGSRSKRPELGRLANIITSRLPTSVENVNPNKSNSAPMLSSSWGHNSVANERMADLMEMDFSRTNLPTTISSSPSSYSQSQSHSTATDTSSYVDMSPGQPHGSHNALYVDMSGVNKVNRNNNNNNTTTNHNHNTVVTPTTIPSVIHKPSLKTLKPVVEAEGLYMRMDNSLNDWRTDISPKQLPSPMQEDYMQMNGPPGVNRTAPVDLPQPRKPPEGYVEMGPFKTRPSLEQDYINMKAGVNRPRHRQRPGNRKDKSRTQPIAIKASKPSKTPCFLPLTNTTSPETLTTPTSSATIFPFSLNSPQSPVKPFDTPKQISETSSSDCSPDVNYAVMTPLSAISAPIAIQKDQLSPESPESPQKPPIKTLANILTQNSTSNPQNSASIIQNSLQLAPKLPTTAPCPPPAPSGPPENPTDSPVSPLTKRLTDNLILTKSKQTRNSTSPVTISLSNSTKEDPSPSSKQKGDKPGSPGAQVPKNPQEIPQSPVTKKLSELSVSKSKLVGPSPNTSPTPTGTLKMAPKAISPKIPDDTTPIGTPTPTPSPLDSEGYEKLQPGVRLLHYASLDLPESTSVPPVSPTLVHEGFRYAEIDFAKLKQH